MSTSKWLGLWKQERAGLYAGQVIKKQDIPKYTRIVLRQNRFYKAGGNRPRFIYCFTDSEGYENKCIPIEYEETTQNKIDELAEVLRQGRRNADIMALPSESNRRANELYNRAIEIIEELTGEEWEFSWLNIC